MTTNILHGNSSDVDYDDLETPAESDVARIVKLANDLIEINRRIDRAKRDLDEMERHARCLSELHIPEAMDDAGVSEFQLMTGEKVRVSDVVRANISAPHMADAVAWLEANDGGDLIKTVVSSSVPRGERDLVDAIMHAIQLTGAVAEQKNSVHWGTLTAWVKERMSAGQPIDNELLGVYVGRKTEIKRGK